MLKYCKRNKVQTNKQTSHHHLEQNEAPKYLIIQLWYGVAYMAALE